MTELLAGGPLDLLRHFHAVLRGGADPFASSVLDLRVSSEFGAGSLVGPARSTRTHKRVGRTGRDEATAAGPSPRPVEARLITV
jgi:hypothetical protein